MKIEDFDRIFYINLDRRQDRRIETEKLLDELVDDKSLIERFSTIDVHNGSIGCALSHLEVLRISLSRGYKKIIIFEDDIELNDTNGISGQLGEITVETDWKVIMLSGNVKKMTHKHGTIVSIEEAQTTAAYAVRMDYAENLIHSFEDSLRMLNDGVHPDKAAIDQNWKKLQEQEGWYGFNPMPLRQRSGYSDIEKRNVDYKC